MNSQTITMLIPVAIVAFILWVRARNHRKQRRYEEQIEYERRIMRHNEEFEARLAAMRARNDAERAENDEEHTVEQASRKRVTLAATRPTRSQLRHPEQYTKEEILEAVARGFIPPDDPAVTAFGKYDPELRGDADLAGDLNDPDFDDDLRDDFDKDFEDPGLRDDFDDDPDNLDDSDFDDDSEGDWDREDAVMRAQSNLRIMREEDQNYALDAIEAEVLNLDHEPDEDELVAIADRAADFYDMSEDYRDY